MGGLCDRSSRVLVGSDIQFLWRLSQLRGKNYCINYKGLPWDCITTFNAESTSTLPLPLRVSTSGGFTL